MQFVDSPSTYRKRMMAIVIGMVPLAIACGSGDAEPEKPRETADRQAVVRWVHDDITYPVVSGIAVPGYWEPEEEKVKVGLEGEGIRLEGQ